MKIITVVLAQEIMFLKCIDDFNFVQLIGIPSNTHGNILDLVLSNTQDLISEVAKCYVDFTSDHSVISFSINIEKYTSNGPKRYVFNYKRADYGQIKNQLQQSNLTNIIRDSNDVNTAWTRWHTAVTNIMNKNIPKVCVKEMGNSPWFDNEAKHTRNKKCTAFRKAKSSGSPKDWRKYKLLRNSFAKLLKDKHTNFIANL
jgi:hypothetical protein